MEQKQVYFRILNNEASGELTYVLGDLDAREAVVVDPHACDSSVLLALLAERELRLRWRPTLSPSRACCWGCSSSLWA